MTKKHYLVPEMELTPVELQGTIAQSGVVVDDYPNIWGDEYEW